MGSWVGVREALGDPREHLGIAGASLVTSHPSGPWRRLEASLLLLEGLENYWILTIFIIWRFAGDQWRFWSSIRPRSQSRAGFLELVQAAKGPPSPNPDPPTHTRPQGPRP